MVDLPLEGGCRCGRVRFRVTEAPLLETVCHCRGCQQMTGSAYSTTVTVPTNGFSVTEGQAVVGGLAHGHTGSGGGLFHSRFLLLHALYQFDCFPGCL